MYVSGFCRGTFICNGARTGICGQRRLRGKLLPYGADGPHVQCSCSHNEATRNAYRAAFFARAEESAQLQDAQDLSVSGWKRRPYPRNATGFRGEFVREHLSGAVELRAEPGVGVDEMRKRHLEWAFRQTARQRGDSSGLFLEFGVRHAVGLNFLAGLAPDVVWHGFDSFEGLPAEKGDRPKTWRKVGMYSLGGRLPAVRENVHLHAGWFNTTLAPFLVAQQRRDGRDGRAHVAFAHLDADLYSSTLQVLDELASRCMLRPGTILAFDELFGHPTLARQEYRALTEAARKWALSYEFLSFMLHPESKFGRVSLRLTSVAHARTCERGQVEERAGVEATLMHSSSPSPPPLETHVQEQLAGLKRLLGLLSASVKEAKEQISRLEAVTTGLAPAEHSR